MRTQIAVFVSNNIKTEINLEIQFPQAKAKEYITINTNIKIETNPAPIAAAFPLCAD